MSRPIQTVCDGCGKVKQQSNHWWTIGVSEHGSVPNGMFLCPSDVEVSFDTRDTRFTLYDLCGRECALKFISEQMGKQS